jgi:hypothetical protein
MKFNLDITGERDAYVEFLEHTLMDTVMERDVARRTLCNEYSLARNGRNTPHEIAVEMGWDCYDAPQSEEANHQNNLFRSTDMG